MLQVVRIVLLGPIVPKHPSQVFRGMLINQRTSLSHQFENLSKIYSRECSIGFECSDPANPKECSSGTLATSANQTVCLPCPANFDCSLPTDPVFIAPTIIKKNDFETSSCCKSVNIGLLSSVYIGQNELISDHHRILMKSNQFNRYQVIQAIRKVS